MNGSRSIVEALAMNKGYSVVGGGDSAKLVEDLNYADKLSFVSTGGGAARTGRRWDPGCRGHLHRSRCRSSHPGCEAPTW